MNYLLVFLILTFSNMPIQCFVEARSTSGFSIPLIHRYSPMSPFFNHSTTHDREIASNDALRSIARSKHFLSSSMDESNIESQLTPEGDEYLMKLSIGSPPVEVFAIVDTGSDLIWLQCKPCKNCYLQDLPIFNPLQSSTYIPLSCDSKPCQDLQSMQSPPCGANPSTCEYSTSYRDNTHSKGILVTDTVTFDSMDGQVTAFPNTVFGCGNDNDDSYSGKKTGIVGLGAGTLSLVSQLGDQFQHKFSYCLLPSNVNSGSKLKFGADAVLSGTGVISTPLISKSSDSRYYLNLEAVSFENYRIEYKPMASDEGNIIIDSGTTLSALEPILYQIVEILVKVAVGGLESVKGPEGFKLCYNTILLSMVPEFTMVFHFTGADVTLNRLNIFTEQGDGITCLAMVLAEHGMSIYGHSAQINFQVGYDLVNKQVSFAPADCTKY